MIAGLDQHDGNLVDDWILSAAVWLLAHQPGILYQHQPSGVFFLPREGTWPMIGGADLSWNKNNINMLGVFGLDIFDNFMSIYDYKSDYGTICYTNRLLARGMKTWTFGSGLTALRQAAMYTDKDGIYMETQSGRFIWDGNYEIIEPGKTDGWTEYYLRLQIAALDQRGKTVLGCDHLLPKSLDGNDPPDKEDCRNAPRCSSSDFEPSATPARLLQRSEPSAIAIFQLARRKETVVALDPDGKVMARYPATVGAREDAMADEHQDEGPIDAQEVLRTLEDVRSRLRTTIWALHGMHQDVPESDVLIERAELVE